MPLARTGERFRSMKTQFGTPLPLVRVKIAVANPPARFHAVLTAVRGRTFCVTFDADVRPFAERIGR